MSDLWGDAVHVWAKTDMGDPDSIKWMNLPQHSMDTMLVSGNVWSSFLPEAVRKMLIQAFNGESIARKTIMFLAGCHDVGKATPAFERQAYGASGDLRLNELDIHGMSIPPTVVKSSELRHEISGYWALMEWMASKGVSEPVASRLSAPVGGHHGVFHSAQTYGSTNKQKKDAYYNGSSESWSHARMSVINGLAEYLDIASVIPEWESASIDLPVQSLISGIITVSDWMASNQWLLPLPSNGMVAPEAETQRINRAWTTLGIPSPHEWADAPVDEPSFSRRFRLPDDSTPNAMQTAAVNVAMSLNGPGGMIIIEAPMGGGKTEAALMCADVLGRKNGAGGLAFALPTQATADGILPRLAMWSSDTTGTDSIRLLHGKAMQNDDYDKMRMGEFYDATSSRGLVVNRFFNNPKLGTLANLVVCTIDQILMMALQSKHYDLRHLGLSGKVVIIDEVHAADEYMTAYLIRALEWLGSYHAPVVLLSATLPHTRREALAKAYRRGLHGADAFNRRQSSRLGNADQFIETYPLITKVDTGSVDFIPVHTDEEKDNVFNVRHGTVHDLKLLLEGGGNALIIRNTVGRAQTTWNDIRNDPFFSDWNVELLHARYVSTDRKGKEKRIRESYGRTATVGNGDRPMKSIVVATQVVEQSLDIDFDILLTDICPMDILLQRMGRVHRHTVHNAGRPVQLCKPQVIIDAWRMDDGDGIDVDYNSAFIYGKSKLLRTVALTGFGEETSIALPSQIPSLIQSAYTYPRGGTAPYSEQDIIAMLKGMPVGTAMPEGFPHQLFDADMILRESEKDEKARAREFLLRTPFKMTPRDMDDHSTLIGSNCIGEIGNEERMSAQVRDSSMGLNCILMIREGNYARFVDSLPSMYPDGPSHTGSLNERYGLIPLDRELSDHDIIKAISSQFVSLPPQLSNNGRIDAMIHWMETNCLVEGWQSSNMLKGQFVLLLDEDGTRRVRLPNAARGCDDEFLLSYSRDAGLSSVKAE